MPDNPIARLIRGLLIVPFAICLHSASAQTIPAFPGAEGFGAYARGGRGGDVYHVTNLNPSGAGSFFDAIATVPGAGRTIVFDVSGYIRLPSGSNGTRMTTSKVTIAGQTAPGDGIGFYNNFLRVSGDDVVLRHLRFRRGKTDSSGDCVDLDSGCLNAMLDHVSMAFSTDENISSFSSPPENITLQWSLNSWGLESHSCGGLWDQNHATCHHTLWAHNHTRNPKARPNGLLEWTNNVTFDWDIGFIMGDSQSVQNWKANVINNYFVCPPGNTHSKALVKGTLATNNLPNFTVHLSGNLSDTDGDGILNGTDKGYAIVEGSEYSASESPAPSPGDFRYYKSVSAIAGSAAGVAADTALVAYKKVASGSGALRLDAGYSGALRDEVDTRMIGNLVSQTRNHIHNPNELAGISNAGLGTLNSSAAPVDADQDGMPDYYETALGWNPASQDHNTTLANSGGLITGTTFFPPATVAGYTRLEEYLHFLAIPHGTVAKNIAGNPTSIEVDLSKYTAGFLNAPVFTLSNVTDGTTVQAGPGNSIVTFTPTLNHVGRAGFDFTVTDADGSSWTQAFALLVSQNGLPRDLNWKGDNSSNNWDLVADNWLRNGTPASFSGGDRVAFDDSGSKSPAVNLTGTLAPLTVEVNAAGNYTFAGTGAVSGTLTKRGSGTLTLGNTGANGFSSTRLDEGSIVASQTGSLGSGPVAFGESSLGLPGGGGTFGNPIAINGNATINWTSNSNMYFNADVTGAGRLNLNFSNKLFTIGGSWADFTGNLNTGTSTGTLRINSFDTLDFSQVSLNLGNAGFRHHLNNAQSMSFGALNSNSGAYLAGGDTNYAVTDTYSIGALNGDSAFNGTIADGSGSGHKLGITKVGSGTLTLGGANTYSGPTLVSNGALLLDGSLANSAATVSSGALLGGVGTYGAGATANAGSFLSPGTAPFTGATMTVANGLTLNAATMYCDMSGSSAGANDRIVMNGGTLTYTGVPYFQFLLLDGTLAAGNYDLVTGATNSAVPGGTPGALPNNLPVGTRQTFTVKRTASGSNPSKIWLEVLGDPATLTWTGATSSNWDSTTANNWTGGSPDTFGYNDAVVFNDSSTVNHIAVPATVSPRSILVDNSTRAYSIAGGIAGGSLVKTGSNTLTISNSAASNTYGGGTFINGGSIQLADAAANATGLGTGAVTFNGGTLRLHDYGPNLPGAGDFPNALVVPNGRTGTLYTPQRGSLSGSLTGGGTLNLVVKYVRGDFYGDWSAFTGGINLSAPAYAEFRIAENYGPDGFPNAAINLGANVYMKHTGILSQGAGTVIQIGELGGVAGSALLGGVTGGRALTYVIGGKGTDATFAGTIGEQSPGSTLTNIVKTGPGTWTLSGSGNWAGGTAVEQGSLQIQGACSSTGAVNVSGGAALVLTNGSLATDAVNIDSGASFSGYGILDSDLNVGGTLETRGFTTGTPGVLTVGGGVFIDSSSLTRMRGGISSDLIAISGDLALAGTLQVSLSPGTAFGRYPLITCAGDLTGSVALTGIPAGTPAHLSTSAAGRLDLVIDDSDEDLLPDTWETLHFGNLNPGPDDDNDGDGQSNAMELLTGTSPDSGASRFAASFAPLGGNQLSLTWPSVPGKSYRIETSGTLSGAWTPLVTVAAADFPATSTSHAIDVPAAPDSLFYRVALDP